MKNYIKKLLREGLLGEEFINNVLVGYHVTNLNNWENIKSGGLSVGSRAMQGKGLYAFYDYNHAIRYANKGEVSNPIIVKFEIIRPNRFLILNMDIAKEVFGSEDYHLINQIENYFHKDIEAFFNEYVKEANRNMSFEQFKEKLFEIESDNSEMKQRTFVFHLIPSNLNDELNIIWNGNYGLEYRINNLNLVKVVGYKNIKDNSDVNISIFDKIPDDEKFKPLVDFLKNSPRLDTIAKARHVIEDAYMNVRNNREWDYYGELLNLIDKIK